MGHVRALACWTVAALALAACGGNDNKGSTHTVGGTLSGLSGTVVLTNNGGDDLTLTQDGSFTFATAVAQGSAYDVAVKTQPAGQTCSVASGSGTVGAADVTDVAVTCAANATPTHTVGGTLSGLSGTVVLTNNGGDDLTLTLDGAFTFATGVAEGVAYAVAVKAQPAGQTCSVASGSGTVGTSDVTDVAVTCVTTPTITSFVFEAANNGSVLASDAVGAIGASHIAVAVPSTVTDLTSLVPTITASDVSATVSPTSGAAQDFSTTVATAIDYTVSVTGASKIYAVSVSNAKKNIILFTVDGVDATLVTGGGAGAGTVTLALPCGTDLTSLAPTIALSDGATVNPASGVAQDFTNPVTYAVTPGDASADKSWTATVTAPCP